MNKISDKWKKRLLTLITIVLAFYIILDTFIITDSENNINNPSGKSILTVDDTIPVLTGENNTSITISCDVFLTNSGTVTSGEVRVIAYVMEDNFAVYKNSKTMGKIKNDTTGIIEIPLSLEDIDNESNYDIKILLFENEKLIIKGGLRITAQAKYSSDMLNKTGMSQEYTLASNAPNFEKIH
jgi:hypothetical protein